MRILRAPANVIYDADFSFEFGKAYKVNYSKDADASIVTSGRGVYEALGAAKKLKEEGVQVNVIDMPTIDPSAIVQLYQCRKPVFIAEQNNGYIWSHFRKILFEKEANIDTKKLFAINTANKNGLHYIHSGTYAELAAHYGLDAAHLSASILNALKTKKAKAI